MRFVRVVALAAVVALAGGCTFFVSSSRYAAAPGTVAEPYWCTPSGGTPLTVHSCARLSAELDAATLFAQVHFRAAQATAGGPAPSVYVPGVGAAFRFSGPTSAFDALHPDTLLYDGALASAQVAGIEYNVASPTPPEGFEGPNDTWTEVSEGVWQLRVWILRPFQDQRNVFATSHPCLGASGPVYDATASCYALTHPAPLEVLVSNDDGYDAAGMDAIVEALRIVQPAVHLTVSAPAVNQSGAGSRFTDGPVAATDKLTPGGYPVWAVAGFPVDAVRYALRTRHVNPDVIISGSNNGQNIGGAISLSGTIGAAREGAQNTIPALAISQGAGTPPDFPSSVAAMKGWLTDFLYGRTGRPALEPVTNINVPTCTSGVVKGPVRVPPGPGFAVSSNCLSTVTTFANDVEAFANGFISVSTISAKSGAGT